ncbi:MAG: quinone oxidoreductase [Deltaproteobacteria bacterium]|nr:MAG: quinone oxidoreductase [Deltaproteobacteria bacterium]
MAKAVRIHETGGPEVLRFEDITVPAPGPEQVRVRQTAVGLNMIDTYHRSGLYPLPRLPHGIGLEAAGVVEDVGAQVSGVTVGDQVAYAAGPPGAYATARNVEATKLVPVVDGVTDLQAAAVLLKGMTVDYLIRRTFQVAPKMTVLFHAAAGGVGLLACQWLAHLGATVIGTVGSDEKAELARANGCHHPVVYTREDVVARVMELTDGTGVPVVYDSVGKATFQGSINCLARRGTLVAFGNASGAPEPFDPLILSQQGSLFLTRPTLFDYVTTHEELLASAKTVFDLVATGTLKVAIHQEVPLDQAVAAHRAIESRQTTGATVLLP